MHVLPVLALVQMANTVHVLHFTSFKTATSAALVQNRDTSPIQTC